MGAADFLTRLTAAGFRLRANGESIVVAPASKLTDDIRAEIRQSRQEMLALLKSQTTQSCATCRHLSRVKTCTKPVEAGLLREFGIVWPEPAHGATCVAWSLNPAEAVVAVLTAAGRGGWTDEQMHQWLIDADAQPKAVLDLLRNRGPTP